MGKHLFVIATPSAGNARTGEFLALDACVAPKTVGCHDGASPGAKNPGLGALDTFHDVFSYSAQGPIRFDRRITHF